jgi:hypothetical protein
MEQRSAEPLDQVCDVIRIKHSSIYTEASYVTWITRDIIFHNSRHPNEMASAESEAFLTRLAVHQQLAISPQYQALSALLFLYRAVL